MMSAAIFAADVQNIGIINVIYWDPTSPVTGSEACQTRGE
jgi:hypothetical protein